MAMTIRNTDLFLKGIKSRMAKKTPKLKYKKLPKPPKVGGKAKITPVKIKIPIIKMK